MAGNRLDDSWASQLPGGRTMRCAIPSTSSDITDLAQPACLDVACAPAERFVIALVGLAFEARIAAGPGVFVICRDTGNEVAASLNLAIERGCRSIISFGVAGGLAPHLRPGNWIVASSIIEQS